MTVSGFPDPFVHREIHRCRGCRDHVEVILLAGATCPRDPYYACCNCHETPEATPARLALLQPPAQLGLTEDAQADPSRPRPSHEAA